jgi:mRNA interferase MazF
MRDISFQRGDVVIALLPERTPQGHEQEGERPVVIVGFPDLLGKPRFPMISVIPFTDALDEEARERKWWIDRSPYLYPFFEQGTAGLWKDCVALLDQQQSIDCRRIRGYCGRLTKLQYQPIQEGIEIIIGARIPRPIRTKTC